MQKITGKLTVFFEDPFWVGVYERVTAGRMEACKITFGTEPKEYEVYAFFLQNWDALRFSPPIRADCKSQRKCSPKRIQRAIQKQLETQGIGTKSQHALKLQHEENKTARKLKSRQQKEDEEQRQFALRQQKRKEKHRGK